MYKYVGLVILVSVLSLSLLLLHPLRVFYDELIESFAHANGEWLKEEEFIDHRKLQSRIIC